jgi:hypothetical protein
MYTVSAARVRIGCCESNTATCANTVHAKRVQLASGHRDWWTESEIERLSAVAVHTERCGSKCGPAACVTIGHNHSHSEAVVRAAIEQLKRHKTAIARWREGLVRVGVHLNPTPAMVVVVRIHKQRPYIASQSCQRLHGKDNEASIARLKLMIKNVQLTTEQGHSIWLSNCQ